MTRQEIYEAVEAQALPFIKYFHDDLIKHDRRQIIEDQDRLADFLHFTGECGTHLYCMPHADEFPPMGTEESFMFSTADRWRMAKGTIDCIMSEDRWSKCDLILYYNGATVRKISFKRACEIANEWHQRITNTWRAEERKVGRHARI